jgi:hypothetical protein
LSVIGVALSASTSSSTGMMPRSVQVGNFQPTSMVASCANHAGEPHGRIANEGPDLEDCFCTDEMDDRIQIGKPARRFFGRKDRSARRRKLRAQEGINLRKATSNGALS